MGAVVTAVVLVIVAITKAAEGAWLIILMIPALVTLFTITRRHYDHVASELTLRLTGSPGCPDATSCWCRSAAFNGPSSRRCSTRGVCSAHVRAIYVELDPASSEALRGQWARWGQGVELAVVESPYRSLLKPLLDYIEQIQEEDPSTYITVILPEFVPQRLWQHLLHNQHALLIKGALLFKPKWL